jgi:osmotically-inducible protein OsmY
VPQFLAAFGLSFSKDGETVMRTDADLKADLMECLDAIPAVNASDIVVDVDNGMARLSGKVDTHQTRFQVERTARRIAGLRGLEINLRHGQPPGKKHHH